MHRLARYSLPIVLLCGIILFLPSLGGGFLVDDVYHLAILEQIDELPTPGLFSLYTFDDGDPTSLGPIQGRMASWWASTDFKMNFFRPLSCVFHLLDHRLYGLNPVGYHATTLVLWGLLLAMVVRFYRELARDFDQSPMIALVAGLFFALDDAHALNICWVAHRHVLLGALFSIGAMLHYHRFRKNGKLRSLAWTLLLFGLGLFSAEGSIALVGWAAAYELCLSKDRPVVRLRAAAPILVLALGYLALYRAMGYGSSGSGFYLDPLSNPLDFLWQRIVMGLPFLLTGALTPVNADFGLIMIMSDAWWPLPLAWGMVLLAGLILIPRLLRDRLASFMALAALFSLLPGLVAIPHNRMLLLPSVGFAWVLGAYVIGALEAGWFRRLVALLIVAIHGLAAPVQAVLETIKTGEHARFERAVAEKSQMPGESEARNARVVLVSGPEDGLAIAGQRLLLGYPLFKSVWVVSQGKGEYRFDRTGEASFSLKVVSGAILGGIGGLVFREDFSFSEGEQFRQGTMEVTVTKVAGDRLQEIHVTIDRPLDHPDVWMMIWDGSRYVRQRLLPWTPDGARHD
jgi:hypothetical protein